MTAYSAFKVLLDDPATRPGLGFPSYASAFAEIIEHSKAQFAIGIFGDWGSGKTTLMRAIQQLWVPKTYATMRYSWMTPPARSRRWTRNLSRSVTSSGSERSGAAWFRARCGRCVL